MSTTFWWGKVDSNHRSDKQQIYSLSPLATREFPQIFYCAVHTELLYYSTENGIVKHFLKKFCAD